MPGRAAAAPDGETMRAVMQRCYGAPKVLTVERIAKPAPTDGEVLIKVHAAGLNPYEWHMTTGKPYLLRLFKGLGAPDRPRVGSDFAGTVESVGREASRASNRAMKFSAAPAARWPNTSSRKEDGDIVAKPAELTFEQAAAIPIAAVTALQALRDHGRIAAGQKVLINGASGGVGTYAVQLAKSFGAEVTGVCSTRNVELVRSLGADHVIDYTHGELHRRHRALRPHLRHRGQSRSCSRLRGVLTPKGTLVGIGGSKKGPWIGPLVGMAKRKLFNAFVEQKFVGFVASVTTADLEFLGGLAREGKIRSVIDRRYSLEETGAALEYIGSRRARGKVIVTLD